MIEILMPQGGQDLVTGRVVRWLKKEGDPIQKGDILCEVETEKAMFEIDSPANGYLRRIVVPEGRETPILSVIGLVGDLTESLEGTPAPSKAPITLVAESSDAASQPTENGPRNNLKISPKAKRIAEENHVPISRIQGSGPGGRIVEKDVVEYISGHQEPSGAAVTDRRPEGRIVELDKRRKATAQKMVFSKQNIPHFYVSRAIDVTSALQFREELNATSRIAQATQVSINDLIVRACALALRDFPQLNASFQDDGSLMLWSDISIGLAVSVGDSLMAPVIENADRLPLHELASRTQSHIEAARNGKLLSLAPGRFTVSNMGMYGVDEFIAIIHPPEAAILAIASIQKKVIVENSDLRIRDVMTVTLSVDHRACDGMVACQFVNKVKSLLESPEGLR